MYYKKSVICCDKSGKIVATVTLSGEDGKVGVKISCNVDIDEVFFVGKGIEKSCKTPVVGVIIPYTGGKIGCVLLKKGRVVAVSKGETEPDILLNALRKSKLQEVTIQTPNEVSENTIQEIFPSSCPVKEVERAEPCELKAEIVEAPRETKDTTEPQKKEGETTEAEAEKSQKSEPHEGREIAHFYCSIKKSLDETFTCYPNVKLLEDMIPYSTWVEIKKDTAPYVVGLIREGELPKYVCYGVESDTGHKPPDEIASYCQWLPTDEYKGYWIICQDADSGETIKNEEN